MISKAAYSRFLDETLDFKRWYENLSKGSVGIIREWSRILYGFLRTYEMTLRSLVGLAGSKRCKLYDILMDFDFSM